MDKQGIQIQRFVILLIMLLSVFCKADIGDTVLTDSLILEGDMTDGIGDVVDAQKVFWNDTTHISTNSGSMFFYQPTPLGVGRFVLSMDTEGAGTLKDVFKITGETFFFADSDDTGFSTKLKFFGNTTNDRFLNVLMDDGSRELNFAGMSFGETVFFEAETKLDQDYTTDASPTFAGITLSGLTLGSILFAGTGGLISQDNSNLFFDNTNNRLGVGTASPATILDVNGTATATALTVTNSAVLGSNSAVFQPNADATTFFQVLDADGGTPVLNVDSTNERVGIGTATPGYNLEIVGDLAVDTTTLVVDAVNHRVGIGTSAVSGSLLKATIGLGDNVQYGVHSRYTDRTFAGAGYAIFGDLNISTPSGGFIHDRGGLLFQSTVGVVDGRNHAGDLLGVDIATTIGTSTTGVFSGTVYGLRIRESKTGSGTFPSNLYQVYLEDADLATNNYGIYQVGGSVINYFEGNVGINEASPQDKLEVNGIALFKGAVKYTQDDGNEFISGAVNDGYLDFGATTAHRFNMSTADTDVRLEFPGTTNSGLMRWREDEDRFDFDDHIALRSQKELRFYSNGNYVGFEAPALSADQIWILPTADGDAGAVLTTDGSGTLSWTDNASEKTWAFMSRDASSGTNYVGGFYKFGSADNDFNPSITFGTANVSYAAHFFLVQATGGEGGTDTVIRVTGTSINDQGDRSAADTEDLTVDDDSSAGAYYETAKKWLGQVTIEKQSGPDLLCNYGFCKYWDNNNTAFKVVGIEATWLGAKNDATPDIKLRHHKTEGWTYNNGAAPTPPTELASMATDHNTEIQIAAAQEGSWKRDNLSQNIFGNSSEGTIIELTTTTNRTYAIGNFLMRITPQ